MARRDIIRVRKGVVTMNRKTLNASREFEKAVTEFGLDLLGIELRDTGWIPIKVPAVSYTVISNVVRIYTPVEKAETSGTDGDRIHYCLGICEYEFLRGDKPCQFYAELEAAPRIRVIDSKVPRKEEMLSLLLEGYSIDAIALCFSTTANDVAYEITDKLRRISNTVLGRRR